MNKIKKETEFPKLVKSVNLINSFSHGIKQEKIKEIRQRNDAMLLIRSKFKYDKSHSISSSLFTDNNFHVKIPCFKLQNGENLFLKDPKTFDIYNEVYKINLENLDEIHIDFFSRLPNLLTLSIKFSDILLVDEIDFLSIERYPSLIELNLSFNKLNNSCLNLIRHIHGLKKLILIGNFINENICDLSSLKHLEELDLSHNLIQSKFVNLKLLNNTLYNQHNNSNNNSMNFYINYCDKRKSFKKFRIHPVKTNDNLSTNITTNLSNNIHISTINNSTNEADINSYNTFNHDEKIKYKDEDDLNMTHFKKINKYLNKNFDENFNIKRDSNNQRYAKIKKTFEHLQYYLKTNIQNFFHNLSMMKCLKILKLGNNKIHFFDIDPYYIAQNKGFCQLKYLDLANNLIEDDLAILLIVNLPEINYLDLTNNPITKNNEVFENVRLEIYKSKNFLVTNNVTCNKVISKYTAKDLLNFPPKNYFVKKARVIKKRERELITYVKPDIPLADKSSKKLVLFSRDNNPRLRNIGLNINLNFDKCPDLRNKLNLREKLTDFNK